MAQRTRKICRLISALTGVCIFLLVLFSYAYYLDIKKSFLIKLSARAGSAIGQRVIIGDLSLGLPGRVDLHNIRIKNPEVFGPGELLVIKRLSLDIRPSHLLNGLVYMDNISVHAPRLELMRDAEGRTNISEGLRLFLTAKSTTNYHIINFRIDSGAFIFNKDPVLTAENIGLSVGPLSSGQGTKTLIKGSAEYGGNTLLYEGLAYLKDDPQKFSLSVSSKKFSPRAFGGLLNKFRIDPAKTEISFDLNLDGNTKDGVNLRSGLRVKRPGFRFLDRDLKETLINTDAFFNPQDGSLLIRNASLTVDDFSKAVLEGIIRGLPKDPAYDLTVKAGRLDLAAFDFLKDLKVSGMLRTDSLHLQGKFASSIPRMSGSLSLRNAALSFSRADLRGIDSDIIFSSDREFSVRADSSARVIRAGEYTFDRPAGLRLSLTASGRPENMSLLSSLTLSPIALTLKEGSGASQTFSIDRVDLATDGSIRDKIFSGKETLRIKTARYKEYAVPWLNSTFSIALGKNRAVIRDMKMESGLFTASLGMADAEKPIGGQGFAIQISGFNAVYPERSAEVRDLDLSAVLPVVNRGLSSADFAFSAAKLSFEGIEAGPLSGKGKVRERDFSIDIPKAGLFSGLLEIGLEGRTGNGFFPVGVKLRAKDMDIGAMTKAGSRFSKFPYTLSGNMKAGAFDGVIASGDEIHGNAHLQAGGISLSRAGAEKKLLKDASLNTEIIFRGKDLGFRSEAGAGKAAVKFSGTVSAFTDKDREINLSASIPEVKASDIRDSFWEMFPDGLLYAGLEGSLSSELSVDYQPDRQRVSGSIRLRDFSLSGENNEYSIGPVNGTVPLAYDTKEGAKEASMPAFEYSEFDRLSRRYAHETVKDGFSRITAGSLRYGFRLFEDMEVLVNQQGTVLNIRSFSANIFGGKLNGSAVIDISGGLQYRAGAILEGLSMTKLCDDIEPIRGYISGRVNGIAYIKGSGMGMTGIKGRADFWTYSAGGEKTRISREFLRKIGGPSLKTYIGDRNFSKGVMSLYLQDGFVIFKELEISNRNFFGMTDLSVKVAPFNNRIAISHLMWTITETAQRAKKE